jgi:hypothetical protein
MFVQVVNSLGKLAGKETKMRRLMLVAMLFMGIGCSEMRPSWMPDSNFFTDSPKEFFQKDKQDIKTIDDK